MARKQFRVDLGYKEMEISSHLFNSLRRNHRDPPYGSNVVVDYTLSDQFSSLSLFRPQPRTVPSLPSTLQSFRAQDLSVANHVINGGIKADQRLYELHLSRLRKNESQQDGTRVLQRQGTRFDKRGLAHRKKESVGTGVFHPIQRPTSSDPVVTSIKKPNQMNPNQSEKKIMIKERRGVMSTTGQQQQKQEQDECHYHLPPDMDFSKDWTF